MAVKGVPVPQENSLQLAPQAILPAHQQRGASRLGEVTARPVGGSYRAGAESGPVVVVPGPSPTPCGARTLTDVGGTFGHHVLVVVDSGIWDLGLGLVHRDHKEFLGERGGWKQCVCGGGDGLEVPRSRGWGGGRSVGLGTP